MARPLDGPLTRLPTLGPMVDAGIYRAAENRQRLEELAQASRNREQVASQALAAALPQKPTEPEVDRLALLPRYEEPSLMDPESGGWIASSVMKAIQSGYNAPYAGAHGEASPEDALNFAGLVTGGSLGVRRPQGSVGMGGRVAEPSQLGAPEGMEAYRGYGANGKPTTLYRPKGEGARVRQENYERAGAEERSRLEGIERERADAVLDEPLQPTDRPRVDWPEETPAPAELTRKSVGHGERYLPGAPAHVKNVQQQTAIANDYLAGAARGALGRDWYDKVERLFRYTSGNEGGNRPGAQDAVSAVFADYSPRATLQANRLAQTRAGVQHATGEPIAAGMGPRNEAARSVLEEGTLNAEGLKVGPFGMQVRGLEAPRGVHDTRDLQAFGFPKGMSPSETNHRWMDMMMDRMVERANAMKLGGFDDWDHKKLQAARWVAHKSDEEGVPIEELAKALDPIDEQLTANIYSEAIPSKELSNLVDMNEQAKREYTEAMVRALSTPEGQDALSLQMGLETPRGAGMGYGEWEGRLNPNIRNRVLVDPAKGSDEISAPGKTAVDFRAAISGLLGGQADTAYSYIRPAKKTGRENSVAIDLGRPASGQDMLDYMASVKSAVPDEFVIPNLRNETSIELTAPGGGGKDWRNAVAAAVAERGGTARPGYNSGGLTLSDPAAGKFMESYTPSAWLTKLQNPTLRASVEQMLPQAAAKIERLARDLPLTDAGKNVYLKTLELIKSGGLGAVEDAVKKGILPAAVLAILIDESNPAVSPSAVQDLRRSTAAGS